MVREIFTVWKDLLGQRAFDQVGIFDEVAVAVVETDHVQAQALHAAPQTQLNTPAEDTVARLGGDEFVVLLTALADIAERERAAAHILATVREPIDVGGHTVQ